MHSLFQPKKRINASVAAWFWTFRTKAECCWCCQLPVHHQEKLRINLGPNQRLYVAELHCSRWCLAEQKKCGPQVILALEVLLVHEKSYRACKCYITAFTGRIETHTNLFSLRTVFSSMCWYAVCEGFGVNACNPYVLQSFNDCCLILNAGKWNFLGDIRRCMTSSSQCNRRRIFLLSAIPCDHSVKVLTSRLERKKFKIEHKPALWTDVYEKLGRRGFQFTHYHLCPGVLSTEN